MAVASGAMAAEAAAETLLSARRASGAAASAPLDLSAYDEVRCV